MRDNGLGVVALVLGLMGLFSGGLLVFGSLLGLGLGLFALRQARAHAGGADVAWSAICANVFALLSVVPLALLLVTLWPTLSRRDDDSLPEPIPETYSAFIEPQPPPPPPPPPPPRSGGDSPSNSSVGARLDTGEPQAAGDSTPVRIGGNIREPHRLHYVDPVYPDIAKQARVQGIVVLECTISPAGAVTAVTVLRPIPLLDAAAVEAVRQWRYTPTLLEGRPVPVIMTVTVNFRLD